ncbi:sphingomyelin phosphodiesterase [Thalictrum thalictroides]|uniref:Sphingomyelin phosphodiesterase n=1 Tax=Thalictrum thalictroides TaxID=46969 RepID=A0A7J6WAG0_THATH|nr:sphingomyelin phosphodiesterase [Thalictrum thalictroides]
MVPHLYAMDSQTKAQELLSKILSSSSSPSTISSTCDAIEDFLQKHTVDQKRSFFSIAFPSLICKVFGFDEVSSSSKSSSSWIDQIQALNDSELELRVFNLLSPFGTLFSSIHSVDRNCLVKYVFPVERLPEWIRLMLQSEKDCLILADLCPLFKGRVKEDTVKGTFQVQLNVFEYYMFWFAYYPICRGNSENPSAVVAKKSRRFRLEKWTSSIPVLAGGVSRGPAGQSLGCGLYIRLLYAYLHAFVPNYGVETHQPYRSSLLHYSSGYDGSLVLQMEFMVYTLIHFWLVDNDFSPLSVNVCKSFGMKFPFRAVLGETPPTSGLGEVLMLFVKYLNSSWVALNHGSETIDLTGTPRSRALSSVDFMKSTSVVSQIGSGCSVASSNSLIQRPLYRFVLRTFLFCPVDTYIRNASQVFSLWISYIEPWKASVEEFTDLDAFIGQPPHRSGDEKNHSRDTIKDSGQSTSGYTSSWEGYVLSNYLFYSSLVMHFLGFAHKFLHTDVEAIIQMVLKVLNILTSSRELRDLMKRVDAAFHSRSFVSSPLMVDNSHKYVPSIREQLQDWEDGLCENDADGSFLHDNWNQDLRLLSDGEDGGQQLLQLLILRAESEIHAISGDNHAKNLQNLDSMRSQMEILFGSTAGSPKSVMPEMKQCQHTRDDLFKPRWVGNHKLVDVRYKGDWMKRPISSGEVSWLARLLVRLSDWLNELLGLNHGQSSDASPSVSYVDVPNDDLDKVGGLKEVMGVVLSSVMFCVLFVCRAVLRFTREHGYRLVVFGHAEPFERNRGPLVSRLCYYGSVSIQGQHR